MKKIFMVVCILVIFLTSCTLVPSQDKSGSQTTTTAESSKVKAAGSQEKAITLSGIKRPSKVTDKQIAEVQKVFNNYLSGKIKMVDANKQLGNIANKIGNVPLAWIIRNLP